MNPDGRMTDDELLELVALADDDPRLESVRRDPGAWTRLLALREFLVPGPAPAGARPEEAERRLREAVVGALAANARPAAAPAGGPAAAKPRAVESASRSRTIRPAWGAARWGWLAAAAAVMVVSVVLLPRRDDGPRVRGGEGPVPALALVGAAPGEGGVRLEWRSTPGADRYEVTLLGPDLGSLGPARETAETTLVVPRAGTLASVPPGGTVLWRVTAVRHGVPLAESQTQSFTLP